jgi:hypothetical protein
VHTDAVPAEFDKRMDDDGVRRNREEDPGGPARSSDERDGPARVIYGLIWHDATARVAVFRSEARD